MKPAAGPGAFGSAVVSACSPAPCQLKSARCSVSVGLCDASEPRELRSGVIWSQKDGSLTGSLYPDSTDGFTSSETLRKRIQPHGQPWLDSRPGTIPYTSSVTITWPVRPGSLMAECAPGPSQVAVSSELVSCLILAPGLSSAISLVSATKMPLVRSAMYIRLPSLDTVMECRPPSFESRVKRATSGKTPSRALEKSTTMRLGSLLGTLM